MSEVQFKNIRNVRRVKGDTLTYICDLDLKVEGEDWEVAEYCARWNGGGICNHVMKDIQEGKYSGEIVEWEPSREDLLDDLRLERNDRLKASDAYVLPDRWAAMSEEKRSEWAAYRQALRDLPETCIDPEFPIWPKKPD